MEQNPNEETVDVNASPQQPEAKDTLETTDDMDSQAAVKTEGSTEADTVASQEKEAIKEAIPEETALEAEPAQDTEKTDAEADTEAGATEKNTAKKKRFGNRGIRKLQLQRQKLVQKGCRLLMTPRKLLPQKQPFLRKMSLQKILPKGVWKTLF